MDKGTDEALAEGIGTERARGTSRSGVVCRGAWEPVWNQRGRMSPAQRLDCASAHGWCCSTSPVRTSSRSTWCCASFRLSILRRRLYIRPHHRIARAVSDVVSSRLLESLLQQAWQRGRRTSCGSPMRLTSEESTIWLVL